MNDINIIVGLEKGNIIIVSMNDGTVLGGIVKSVYYIEELGTEGFHQINLIVDGRVISLDSRRIEKVLHCVSEDGRTIVGRNSLEIYDIELNLSDVELVKSTIEKWDDLNDAAKDDICNVLACSMNKELMKDLIGAHVNLKTENKRLSDLRIKDLDNQIEFFDRYNEFKKYLPEGFEKLYDTLLFDTLGLQLG